MAQMRYIVEDVDRAVAFYTQKLGFELKQQYGPAMAILSYGDLDLWVAGPMSSAAKAMPDGKKPAAGGWNRIVIGVDDIETMAKRLEADGVAFRNEILDGPGGRQVLIEDPSANPIELFQQAS